MRSVWLVAAAFLMLSSAGLCAQTREIDPTWLYTTQPHWERSKDPADPAKTNRAVTTLAILYPTGQYVEVHASLVRETGPKAPRLDLEHGYLLRTGVWTRTDDDIIRTTSEPIPGGSATVPAAVPKLTRTCRLTGRSRDHLAAEIMCAGLLLTPPGTDVRLGTLPEKLRWIETGKTTQ